MSVPLLEVRNLRVRFAAAHGIVHAVDGIDFTLDAGEVLGLVGESGSGKSVTLRAIPRLLHANATITGQVLWRGEDLLGLAAGQLRRVRGRAIGMVFQEPMAALNPVLSIGQQIDEVLVEHSGRDAGQRRARAIELLGLVGIAAARERLAQYPHEFSGGMRQRAMLAIALAAEPALLLADEPTTALDVTIQDQILRLLLRLKDELGMALLLVTHDLGVVAETCDRVAVMYAGRICETGLVEAVFSRPRHAYTDALLRSMPGEGATEGSGTGAGRELVAIPGQPPRVDAVIAGCAFAPRCTHVLPDCTTTRPLPREMGHRHLSACHAADGLATP